MSQRASPSRTGRLFSWIACALAALLAGGAGGAARTPRPLGVPDQSCKPGAPIRILLEELPSAGGSRVELRFSLEPLIPMEALEWELDLPADTLVAQGTSHGFARRELGQRTEGRVRLSMPADGAFRQVSLLARGVFQGADQDGNVSREEVVGSRTLTWGKPEPAATVLAPDGPERELVPQIVLPTRHQSGRRPGWKASAAPEREQPRAELGGGVFMVTGVFEYEDKAWGYNGWNGSDPSLPVRRADVTVLDAVQTVLGTGSTAQDGSFSIVCTSVGVTDVTVRVNSDTDLDPGQRIRVTDQANVEYTGLTPVFAGHDTSLDLDVGTTTVAKVISGSGEGNAFNMLDMGVATWEYITGPLIGAAAGSAVRIWWPESGGSFASGLNAHISSDDGYDDSVILHEIGHVVQNMYSDSDNPGGSHGFGDSDQDPRLSFGEGYATFLAGAVMIGQIGSAAIYMDGSGSAQNGGVGLHLRLESVAPYGNDAFGAADEVAVAVILYDILDDEDTADTAPGSDDDQFVSTTLINGLNVHRAWWDVFTGPVALASNLTLNDAWNGWFSEHGAGGLYGEMKALYDLRRVHFYNDVDEPNDTDSAATPSAVNGLWSTERTLYTATGNPPVPGLGDEDWYALDLVIGSVITIETRYPNAASDADTQADTHVRLVSPTGVITESDTGGVGRNAALTSVPVPETGTWRVRVKTLHSYRRYGRYDVRFSYAFQNHMPVIAAGPSASPATLGLLHHDSTLSVNVTDDQPQVTLSYEWTPQDGGTIVGSGSSVTFVPPAVTTTTTFHIELVVEDFYGARTAPVTVAVTVKAGPRAPIEAGPRTPVGP